MVLLPPMKTVAPMGDAFPNPSLQKCWASHSWVYKSTPSWKAKPQIEGVYMLLAFQWGLTGLCLVFLKRAQGQMVQWVKPSKPSKHSNSALDQWKVGEMMGVGGIWVSQGETCKESLPPQVHCPWWRVFCGWCRGKMTIFAYVIFNEM